MCMLAPQPTAHARPARTNPRDRNHQATPDAEAPQPQRRSSLLANLCIVVMFLVPVGGVLTNTDWVVFGPVVIPGMRLYDAFSMMLSAGVLLLPSLSRFDSARYSTAGFTAFMHMTLSSKSGGADFAQPSLFNTG